MALVLLAVVLFIGAVAWLSVLSHRREARRSTAWVPSFEWPPPPPPPRPLRAPQPSSPRATLTVLPHPKLRAASAHKGGRAVSKVSTASSSDPLHSPLDYHQQHVLLQGSDDDSRNPIGGGGAFGGAGASGGWSTSSAPEPSHTGVDTPASTVETASPGVDAGGGGSPTVDAGTSFPSD